MVGETLPPDWYWATLGEVADPAGRAIVSGPFGSNIGSKFFVTHGVPVIRGNNLTTDLRRFVDHGFVFVTEEKALELGNCEAIADDLVFTAAGSLGQVGLIPKKSAYSRYIISNKQLRARVDTSRIDPLFAFYWFSSREMVAYVQQRNTGSSVPLINLGVLRSLPLPVPPLAEQSAIARLLGNMDDRIELNWQMNETLHSIAKTLFRSWFIDFDPVCANASGREVSLPTTIANHFPDSFQNSELGKIPTGWRVGTILDLAGINEWTLSRNDYLEFIDYIEISEVMKGEVGNVVRYERGAEPSRARRRLRHGDTVLSTVRPDRGAYFLSLDPPETLIASTGFAVLSPRDGNWAFLHSAVTQEEFGEQLGRLADGGAYPAIRPEVIGKLPIIIPETSVIALYERLIRPLFEKSAHARAHSTSLAAMRNTLLPKLVSGALRIKEAERIIGRPL